MQRAPPSAQPLLPVDDKPPAGRPEANKFVTAFVKWSSLSMVDAFLAAGGLIFAGVFLRGIDLAMAPHPIPLFNGAMLTMAIVFFANPAPPPYKVFLQCTVGAWFLGMMLKFMMLESVMVTIIVAGCLLIFFKWAKVMFPPTLGVAVFLISDQTLLPPVSAGVGQYFLSSIHWLVTPWLVGSIWFYFISKATSVLRARVKTRLSLLKFAAAFEGKTDAELIQAFKGKYLQEVHVASKSPCACPCLPPDGLDNSDPRFLCMRPPLCSSQRSTPMAVVRWTTRSSCRHG